MKTGGLSHPGGMAKGENKKWACAHWCASPKPVLHNSSEVNNTPEARKRQTTGHRTRQGTRALNAGFKAKCFKVSRRHQYGKKP
jgi:hypothetical protein